MLTVLVPLPKTSNENCANSHEKNHNQGHVKTLFLIGSAGGEKCSPMFTTCMPYDNATLPQYDFKHCESESSSSHLQRHV